MSHLLVTNDFPPKIGGIQSYLYELWRRLPPDQVTVYTTAYAGSANFDRSQLFRVVRSRWPVMLPMPDVVSEVRRLADETGAGLVVLDPALPLGIIGRQLNRPYAVVLHGAEVTVPGRLPGSRQVLQGVLANASLVVAAGRYPAAEGRRALGTGGFPPTVLVPPGVDTRRFQPLTDEARRAARRHLGLPEDARIIVSVSRLVPRKGMDVLIEAVARLAETRPDVGLVIGGTGRDRKRLEILASLYKAPVRFLGRVAEEDLPLLDASADIWAMVCRDRWFGLEQEGFGIVFLEAAASGVAQVAGRSGGADEAVLDGETGIVVGEPGDPAAVAVAMAPLLDDPQLRRRLGAAARRRVEEMFDYDVLARRLLGAIVESGG
ncbi:MAG: glycosyltransferase family 4 protein [Actinomycetota bacterium]|nr:glycosyltransferase family 4 protein [Actinomycetota bacterium]